MTASQCDTLRHPACQGGSRALQLRARNAQQGFDRGVFLLFRAVAAERGNHRDKPGGIIGVGGVSARSRETLATAPWPATPRTTACGASDSHPRSSHCELPTPRSARRVSTLPMDRRPLPPADLVSAVDGFLRYGRKGFGGSLGSAETREPLRQAQRGRCFSIARYSGDFTLACHSANDSVRRFRFGSNVVSYRSSNSQHQRCVTR